MSEWCGSSVNSKLFLAPPVESGRSQTPGDTCRSPVLHGAPSGTLKCPTAVHPHPPDSSLQRSHANCLWNGWSATGCTTVFSFFFFFLVTCFASPAGLFCYLLKLIMKIIHFFTSCDVFSEAMRKGSTHHGG